MRRAAKLVTVLLVTLLMMNGQCLARCIGSECHGNKPHHTEHRHSKVPPCHSGEGKKQNAPFAPCALSIVAALKTSALADIGFVHIAGSLTLIEHQQFFVEHTEHIRYGDTSPLHSPALIFSTVLRI